MTKKLLPAFLLAGLCACAAFAQEIAGDWRGTLKAGPAELRLTLHIVKADKGFTGTLDSIDQGANGIPVSSVTLKGSDLDFSVDAVNGTYAGKISADGTSIKGTWTQGQPLSLDFERGTFKKTEPKLAKPSDIDGTWSGKLEVGEKGLRIVFHIFNTEEGLMATADSPDQGTKGAPVSSVTRNGSALKLEIRAAGAQFEGKIDSDLATVTGTFTQGGNNMPLVLTRTKGGAQ